MADIFSFITMALLSFSIFFYLSPVALSLTSLSRIQLPPLLSGPESLAFDLSGGGPYTGVSDGRILKIQTLPNLSFKDFAYTSPNRSKERCDGATDVRLQARCGRPLGLGFYYRTGDLYIADAYNGLMVVGSEGGTATQLLSHAEGVPFKFLAGLDVDQTTGVVYFTEATNNFQFRDIQKLVSSQDKSGSLFSYDPKTREVRVLLRGLSVAAGTAVSKDGTFVLVSEFLANRIQRFWLKGPKANTSEIFLRVAGKPDNIKRNSRGEFWMAVNKLIGPPPPPRPLILPLGVRVSQQGRILQTVDLSQLYENEAISEIQEFNGKFYATSLHVNYASVFRP